MRRVKRSFAILVVGACAALVVPLAGSAQGAGGSGSGNGNGGGGSTEVLATLKIDSDNVEVRKAGKDAFKPATDGQKLRQGDTVRTDASGRAEVDYSEDAYTRLDFNTTLTITKLTEEQGERQVETSLDAGRTWNRTEAVTESGSFEQSSAGATAAVTGTAFMVECTSVDLCTFDDGTAVFTAVIHSFILSGNGEVQTVDPLQQCDSTSGDLCGAVRQLTIDEIAAIAFVQEMLTRDMVERGLCCGPFTIPLKAAVNVDLGLVTSFAIIQQPTPPPTITSSSSSSSTSSTPPPPPPPPPAIDASPVFIDPGGLGGSDPGVTNGIEGANTSVVTEDEISEFVTFVLTVTNPDGSPYFLVFTDIPDPAVGTLYADGVAVEVVDLLVTHYAPTTVFSFDPIEIEPVCDDGADEFSDCYTRGVASQGPNVGVTAPYPTQVSQNGDGVTWSDSFTFKAVDEDTGAESAPVVVPIVVFDDICAEGSERTACDVLQPPSETFAAAAPPESESPPADPPPEPDVPAESDTPDESPEG